MELSQYQRVQLVVKWLAAERGVNQRDIGRLVGWQSPTAFSQMLNGKKSIPAGLPEKLTSLDPRINIDFMSGVSDEMILGEGVADVPPLETSPASKNIGIYIPSELAQMVTDMTSVIKEQQAMIRTLVDAWVKRELK